MANATLPSMSRGAAPLTAALLSVLGLAACNAILGNEDRYLVEPSCAAGACPSTDAGGQAGTGAGATTTGTGGTATGGSSSGMGGTTGVAAGLTLWFTAPEASGGAEARLDVGPGAVRVSGRF
jgi:hypothetical protein